jgi:hypothetical protein
MQGLSVLLLQGALSQGKEVNGRQGGRRWLLILVVYLLNLFGRKKWLPS